MISIAWFPELVHDYNRSTIGVTDEASNRKAARQQIAHVLRERGYRPTFNKTWVKEGYAAVILP